MKRYLDRYRICTACCLLLCVMQAAMFLWASAAAARCITGRAGMFTAVLIACAAVHAVMSVRSFGFLHVFFAAGGDLLSGDSFRVNHRIYLCEAVMPKFRRWCVIAFATGVLLVVAEFVCFAVAELSIHGLQHVSG